MQSLKKIHGWAQMKVPLNQTCIKELLLFVQFLSKEAEISARTKK